MKSDEQAFIETNMPENNTEYVPPRVDYVPFQPDESGIRTKLTPNIRDCYDGCWGKE